ncbi:nucleotidyltransferase domain-containing protein [Zobellella maritima]|uniref:nucleotidyltransferase domain-containing protein n=1 Tax=Zobellella maritima TaxID=2059725 RepID=UPI0013007DDB|nr:nucleotidyltransferase domain-containing protein [Zobellella maritima]
MIEWTQAQQQLVVDILRRHLPTGVRVHAFGSRTRPGQSRPYSDLDLLLTGPGKLSRGLLFTLEEAFELSALPYRVDIVDAHRIAPSFLAAIQAASEPVPLSVTG